MKLILFILLIFHNLFVFPQEIISTEKLISQLDSQDNKIICLGESMHRIETFNCYKTELMKVLYEKLGYEIVLFESGILDVANGFYNIKSDTVFLKESLYGIWQTSCLLNFFHYVRQNKIILGGFDLKGNSSYSTSTWLKNIFHSINKKYSEEVFKVDTALMNDYNHYDSDINNLNFLENNECFFYQNYYSNVLDSLKHYKRLFIQNKILDEIKFNIVERAVLNRKFLSIFLGSKNIHQAFKYRNEIMMENILWFLNNVYYDKKIIIWAHNNHISKKTTFSSRKMGLKSSIDLLPNQVKNNIISVSLDFIENAPKKVRQNFDTITDSNTIVIKENNKRNKYFDYTIYFKNTETIDKYKIK